MSDAAPATAPRWIPLAAFLLGLIVPVSLLLTAVMAIGTWRAEVNQSIVGLQKRMDTAEGNQRTYIPVLIGLSKDVSYLAERARREDDRSIRDRR